MHRSFMPKSFSFLLFFLVMFSLFSVVFPSIAWAQQIDKVGIHILHTEEIEAADALFKSSDQESPDSDSWHYVTVPFTYTDLSKKAMWRAFFARAKELHIIPILRLATRSEGATWVEPERRIVVEQLSFLGSVEWPTAERHVIVYNEVNHSNEWGGRIDPVGYARFFEFVSSWAHTEVDKHFVVLPAALDLAAPTGTSTMEAFMYLEQMRHENQEIFMFADAWNSHSYPNPGFSAPPQRVGKNSMRGFEHELAYLKKTTGQDFKIFITETGWDVTPNLVKWLPAYYEYAVDHIWSHPQVVAVTPFVLQGAPGPYEGFSFLDEAAEPTAQYEALVRALTPSLAQN